MPILTFSLNPEALNRFYDIFVCLGKFSDYVSLEASQYKLVLTTLNSSKSAYASFTLNSNRFFSKYHYKSVRSGRQIKEKFVFKIYNRALLSVFKGQAVDQNREKETAIEKCEAYIDDEEENSNSRFVVSITCRHGVRKIHRLTFESVPLTLAVFNKNNAHNRWSICSKVLREFTDHFGPGTEQLDIYSENGRVNFTSFTEKIKFGNEILKKPLHTTIAMDILEFSEFNVEELLHIVISVKDFKAIVAYCGINNVMVNASYSYPTFPMQLTYDVDGIFSEFILMTVGASSVTPLSTITPSEKQKRLQRPASRQAADFQFGYRKEIPEHLSPKVRVNEMPSQLKVDKPISPPTQMSTQSESLFLKQADQDRKWEPLNFDEENEEMLLWDVGDQDTAAPECMENLSENALHNDVPEEKQIITGDDDRSQEQVSIPPTQKLTQIRKLGIFD